MGVEASERASDVGVLVPALRRRQSGQVRPRAEARERRHKWWDLFFLLHGTVYCNSHMEKEGAWAAHGVCVASPTFFSNFFDRILFFLIISFGVSPHPCDRPTDRPSD